MSHVLLFNFSNTYLKLISLAALEWFWFRFFLLFACLAACLLAAASSSLATTASWGRLLPTFVLCKFITTQLS